MKKEIKVLVLTGSDKEMYSVLDLTIPSKLRYARKYGYDFMTLSDFMEYPTLNIKKSTIGIGFSRVIFAYQMLEYYDTVMWLDADSIVTNLNYSIDRFLTSEYGLYFSYDWPVSPDGSTGHVGFSSGNFIIQKTDKIQELFDVFINLGQQYLEDCGADQACLNAIYNRHHIGKHIKLLEHKYLGAVPLSIEETNTWKSDLNRTGPNRRFTIPNPWNEDCFIAHLTGCSNEDRIDLLKNKFSKYL